MRKTIITTILSFSFSLLLIAQTTTIEGHVLEAGNKTAIAEAIITVMQKQNNEVVTTISTNQEGFFSVEISVGKTYLLETTKDLYHSQKTKIHVRKFLKQKKINTKIILLRQPSKPVVGTMVDKGTPTNYYQPTTKYNPTVNPNGVVENKSNQLDPYAEITVATRLIEANYDKGAAREAMKTQSMPTSFSAPVKIDQSQPISTARPNKDLPGNYNQGAINQKITPPAPQFGETVVATAATSARIEPIPSFFTGYKIEFLTALTELPASHTIFQRHGNIALEQKPNGIYSYLLGSFTDPQQAQVFLTESILDLYPNANTVFFENGRRKEAIKRKKKKTKPVSAPPR